MRQCLLKVPQVFECIATIVPGFGIVWPDADRLFETLSGLIDTIHFIKGDTEVVQCLGVLGKIVSARRKEASASSKRLFMKNDPKVIAGIYMIAAQT